MIARDADGRVVGFVTANLTCDADVAPSYERLGGTPLTAIVWRRYDRLVE